MPVIAGTDGPDTLTGTAGDDTLNGLGGDDILLSARGDDLVDGGPGVDTLIFEQPFTNGVFVNLDYGRSISFDGFEGTDTLQGVENAIAGPYNDVLTGSDAPNVLIGLAGSDTITGGGGDDSLDGGDGDDSLSGGDGDDLLIGGMGHDTMAGGAGVNVFEFTRGASQDSTGQAGIAHITDFTTSDILLFVGGPVATAANIASRFVTTYADGQDQARDLFAHGYEYIVMAMPSQTVVFAPRTGVAVVLNDVTSSTVLTPANFANEDHVFTGSGKATVGDDLLTHRAGNETLSGSFGNDTIVESSGTNYLRGDDGNDSIVGGSGFDDINGNQGNDTCVSGGGDDWVVGGKGDDSLVGSDGQNLVYGNLGNDTCDGGAGNDIVRGGQDNDSLNGGAGDDFVSGDKGDDTVMGGAGADIFHTFGDAGIDRVLDFSIAEGDRVQLDPGTQYTVAQVGADTVISMTGGGQMILVGVQMSTLTGNWIFGA